MMKYPLMSAMDLLDFMEKLGVMTKLDKHVVVVSDYVTQPLYVLGKYEPIELETSRIESVIEKFVSRFQVNERISDVEYSTDNQ